jgi:hypothetical protein
MPAGSEADARGTFPTTCWGAGVQVGTSVRLPLPENAPQGEWWVSVSAYSYDGSRLAVTQADGTRDTQIGLGPIRVNR